MAEPTWGAIIIYAIWGISFLIATGILLSYLPHDDYYEAEPSEYGRRSKSFSYTPAEVRARRSGFEWLED